MDDEVRLDEFDQDEWWDVCREVRPDITREEFDRMWEDFVAEKERKKLQ